MSQKPTLVKESYRYHTLIRRMIFEFKPDKIECFVLLIVTPEPGAPVERSEAWRAKIYLPTVNMVDVMNELADARNIMQWPVLEISLDWGGQHVSH